MKQMSVLLALVFLSASTFAGDSPTPIEIIQNTDTSLSLSDFSPSQSSGIGFQFEIALNETGEATAKAGVSVGGNTAPAVRVKESSGWATAGNTIRSPFFIYRFEDSKWFPEWREHPWRTSGMTLVYGGIALALASGGGGSDAPELVEDTGSGSSSGGGSSGGSSTTTPSTPSEPSNPIQDGNL